MSTNLLILICTGAIIMTISAKAQAIVDRINSLHLDDGVTQADVDAAVAEAQAAATAADNAQDDEDFAAINGALDDSPVTPGSDGTPPAEPLPPVDTPTEPAPPVDTGDLPPADPAAE